MNTDTKKLIFGLLLGFGIFWGVKWVMEKKLPKTLAKKTPTPGDVDDALVAYNAAVNAGEEASVLADLNREFADEFGLTISVRSSDGMYIVRDLDGKELKVA